MFYARVVELADTLDLKSNATCKRTGSSPVLCIVRFILQLLLGLSPPFLLVNMAELVDALGIDKYVLVNVNPVGIYPHSPRGIYYRSGASPDIRPLENHPNGY